MLLTRSMSWPEALLVEARVGVFLGKHALERGVVALDGEHGVVDRLTHGGLAAARRVSAPALKIPRPSRVSCLYGHCRRDDGAMDFCRPSWTRRGNPL
jgi:hypothetical protein